MELITVDLGGTFSIGLEEQVFWSETQRRLTSPRCLDIQGQKNNGPCIVA